ncbi:hypothetical protein F5B22DRAFT_638045 [Xylaria bambusicola]|uniref:uncharacterized protein n=1 Tax=Xylaria bambusicola TaxID=326684 RepID=UPI002008A747|nr:uncharacterized protein F5B22DRAFT_638045 [Xylaria bambusicola]KAI0509396.1 hypothetical protein F5B22DRAFT_638045 [Xylaria bambusicola]
MTRSVKPPLSNSDAGLGGLLTHLPDYGVVICKTCRFAIQPSAFSSHLQNHHILRSKRRDILDQLRSLRLTPPERVGVPASDSRPVPNLPILSGFKCDAAECSYACTSVKRMCQHWSDIHGEPNSKAIRYRGARLQTFFRGNKIRYFEVEGPKHLQCWTQKESQLAFKKINSLSPSDLVDRVPEDIQAPLLDHRSLLYMHHYTRHSGLFLNRGNESTEFWVDTIVLEAEKHPFLMYSLLCISAIEKARKTPNTDERRNHLQASASYCAGAISGYRTAVSSPTRENSNAIVACSRLLGQQEAVRDLIRFQDNGNHHFTIDDIIEHLVLLRGCTDLMIQLQSTLPPDSLFRLPDKVRIGLRAIEEHDTNTMLSNPGFIPADTWLVLNMLEARLKAAGLLPASEAPMIRRAINLLAYATAQAYGAQDDEVGWAGWNAVEGWLRSPLISEELLPAMRGLRPSALIVFISWVMILLTRIEGTYDWMAGLSAWFVRVAVRVADNTQMETLAKQLYQFD